jgi:hypothetical protein
VMQLRQPGRESKQVHLHDHPAHSTGQTRGLRRKARRGCQGKLQRQATASTWGRRGQEPARLPPPTTGSPNRARRQSPRAAKKEREAARKEGNSIWRRIGSRHFHDVTKKDHSLTSTVRNEPARLAGSKISHQSGIRGASTMVKIKKSGKKRKGPSTARTKGGTEEIEVPWQLQQPPQG